MPTTPSGLPYPASTDPVSQGASNIQALAEAIKGQQLIREVDLTAGATLSSIPQGFDHLRLVARLRSTHTPAVDVVNLRFNSDASANYDVSIASFNNNVYGGVSSVGQTQMRIATVPAAGALASYFATIDYLLPSYSDAAMMTSVTGTYFSFAPTAGSTAIVDLYHGLVAGQWRFPTAITSLSLIATAAFFAGSRAWLYGVSGA